MAQSFDAGGAPKRLVQYVLDWVCPTCEAKKATTQRLKASLPHAQKFGEGIASDVFFVTDARDGKEKVHAIYSYIDLASTFHQIFVCPEPGGPPSAAENAEEHP